MAGEAPHLAEALGHVQWNWSIPSFYPAGQNCDGQRPGSEFQILCRHADHLRVRRHTSEATCWHTGAEVRPPAQQQQKLLHSPPGIFDPTEHAVRLWVPETPHTSCDLLILVEQSTEPVAPSDGVCLARRGDGVFVTVTLIGRSRGRVLGTVTAAAGQGRARSGR